jgi:predicted nucleic acid-binding protein
MAGLADRMYLIDTNVISEARKQAIADRGVIGFFDGLALSGERAHIPATTVGELRRGVELIDHRGDVRQARALEDWLAVLLEQFRDHILAFDADAAQVWGRLRVPHPQNPLDKQIAATALVYDLTVVTRNTADFQRTGVRSINPFLVLQ